MAKIIFATIAVLSLSGCMASKYVMPDTNKTASIRFVTEGGSANVFTSDLPGCPGTVYSLGLVGSVFHEDSFVGGRVNMPQYGTEGIKPKNYTESLIPAGKPFVIYFRQFTGNSTCHFSFSFMPEPNQFYEAVTFRRGNKCSARLNRLVPDNSGKYKRVTESSGVPHEKMCYY